MGSERQKVQGGKRIEIPKVSEPEQWDGSARA